MDIRVINSKGEMINLTESNIQVSGNWIIGVNANGNVTQVEEYESKEEATERLDGLTERIEFAMMKDCEAFVLRMSDLRPKEKEKEKEEENVTTC